MGSSVSNPFAINHRHLPEDAALWVVRALSINCPCLTEWQIRDCVNPHLSHDERHLREMRRHVRAFLDKLEAAGHVGVHKVPFIAPAAISSEPLFADDGLYFDPPACSDDELARLASATQARVPTLTDHGTEGLYYATVEAAELIRSRGLFAPFPESRLPADQQQRIELVSNLIASHPRGLEEMPPSPPEISRSDLTAVINLGQLLFLDAFTEKVESRECVYSVTATTHEDQRVYGRMERKNGSGTFIALFFLGSLFPHQLRERMLEHSFEFDPWPSRLWWV